MRARILADRSWEADFGVADKFCNLCNSGFELLGSVIMLIPLAMQVSGSAAGRLRQRFCSILVWLWSARRFMPNGIRRKNLLR